MDFLIKTYKNLIETLLEQKYQFSTIEEYFTSKSVSKLIRPVVLMRHDVDRKPGSALRMAQLEFMLGVKSTYYFRTIPKTFKPEVIKKIAEFGHEIGYHYENLSIAQMKNVKCKMKNEEEYTYMLFKVALKDFGKNLDQLRKLYPVKTMCMHGSPMSKLDNRDLWKTFDYREYGIICEPYFDLDFNKVFYITDASRAWNNENVSIRDKVESNFDIQIKSTKDIIKLLQSDNAPSQIMINIHPHNWANNSLEWLKICLWQNCKNIVKRQIIIFRKAL